MPPKASKGGAQKQKPKDEEREESLQAVVLADSFERRFTPFSLEKPRCLLPLANAPLIEYTLEFLAHAGVEEIFVYCGAHTEQVEEYLNTSKWRAPSSPFRSLQLVRSVATSVGDAMRDLDNRGYITGDFLLVAGDVVTNVSVEAALARHRARRAKDKNAIMTMVLREAGGGSHRSKASRRQPVFVVDPRAERCLWYEEVRARHGSAPLELDAELLAEHAEIEVRSDLVDCGIDICTPDVLGLWSDNFDFQEVRASFLRGVLKDYELNGKTFHVHVLRSGYAARVRSLHSYDAVSRDIVERWTYPLVPDTNIFAGHAYQLGRNKTYIEAGVSVGRGSAVRRRTIIGKGSSVGTNSVVTDSVIGERVAIGNNVRISGAYIWSDASVGDDAVVERAVLGERVTVGRRCVVAPGSLLSSGVHLAAGVALPEGTRLTLAESSGTDAQPAEPLVGAGGAGHEYHSPSSSASSSPAASPLVAPARRLSAGSISSISTIHSADDETSPSSSRRASMVEHDRLELMAGTSPESVGLGDGRGAKLQRDFLREATASIHDGMAALEPADKIRLELVAQRLASDAADAAVRDALVAAFMKRVWSLIDGGASIGESGEVVEASEGGAADLPAAQTAEKLPPANAVKAVWAKDAYGWLLEQMGLFDIGATQAATPGAPAKPDQVAVLRAVERSCAAPGRAAGREVLFFVVVEGATGGWLQEEAIEEWWTGVGAPAGEPKADEPPVRSVVKKYVEDYVLGDEESSEEEDESEEEESD